MTITDLDQIEDPRALALLRDWFDRFAQAFPGSKAELATAGAALQAHVLEALTEAAELDANTVGSALAELGQPEALAADWVELSSPQAPSLAQKLISGAAVGFRALGGVLGAVLILGALARLIDPQSVGMVVLTEGTILIGTLGEADIVRDVLGMWTAPVFAILGAACLGVAIKGGRIFRRASWR